MAKSNSSGANFGDWLMQHPRQALQLFFVGFVAIWQLPVAFVGTILFLLFTRLLRVCWWWILSAGMVAAMLILLLLEFKQHFTLSLSISEIFTQGVEDNWQLVKYLASDFGLAFEFIHEAFLPSLLGCSLLVAGILAFLELLPNSRHEKALRALQQGQINRLSHHTNYTTRDISPPFSSHATRRLEARLDSRLTQLQAAAMDGTLLGISKLTEKPIVVPDSHINQMALVLGTTGGGKTITLRRFYERAIQQGYPLLIVDGKPTDENVAWVKQLAAAHGRPFYGFNCGAFDHYDCLAHGGYTELKDKIISLKDEWESDYYRSIAEDYLQTTFEVLLRSSGSHAETAKANSHLDPSFSPQTFERLAALDLKTVVDCLDYETLAVKVRAINDPQLINRVRRLEHYQRKDITGLQAHLNLLIHSELGRYFELNEKTFSLTDVIQNNGVVYFALPALRFPGFSKVLGKLVINDIKAVIDRASHARIFTVFDEFSVFAGEQVLNLVNMGRGKGVHAIFGTQGLADLEKVDKAFANQVLNCVNTIICHRLNDQVSAEAIASWVGTRDSFDVTAQISSGHGSTGMGSVRRNKEFIVHPDAIKQELQPGEAFYITKVGQFWQDKIKVKYS